MEVLWVWAFRELQGKPLTQCYIDPVKVSHGSQEAARHQSEQCLVT